MSTCDTSASLFSTFSPQLSPDRKKTTTTELMIEKPVDLHITHGECKVLARGPLDVTFLAEVRKCLRAKPPA